MVLLKRTKHSGTTVNAAIRQNMRVGSNIPTPNSFRIDSSVRRHSDLKRVAIFDWLWGLLLVAGLLDVVIGYFGRALDIPLLVRPWILIVVPFGLIVTLDIKSLLKLKSWAIASFAGFLLSLLVGVLTITTGPHIHTDALWTMGPFDLISITVAFLIGAIFTVRQPPDAEQYADLLLVVAALHAVVCIVALLHLAPDWFPLIDSPYWRDGKPVSRPEITTDQTRQVLYLFFCLAVVFTRNSVPRLLAALLVALAIVFITFKVQSRLTTILFPAQAAAAFLIAVWYRKQSPVFLIVLGVIGLGLCLPFADTILGFAQDVMWRFTQLDGSYGGRARAISYLADKILDPYFWIPQGTRDFYSQFGGAPHSFPTMVYLSGGLLGLVFYAGVVVVPLAILFKRVVLRTADGVDRIAFFCTSYAFVLLMTQPVINHEIFWIFAGMAVGALGDRRAVPRAHNATKSRYGTIV